MIQYPMKKEMTNFHAFLLVLTLIVLSILFLGGCSTTGQDMELSATCKATCKTCSDLEIDCSRTATQDKTGSKSGTLGYQIGQ